MIGSSSLQRTVYGKINAKQFTPRLESGAQLARRLVAHYRRKHVINGCAVCYSLSAADKLIYRHSYISNYLYIYFAIPFKFDIYGFNCNCGLYLCCLCG